jgi:hypothetical protein
MTSRIGLDFDAPLGDDEELEAPQVLRGGGGVDEWSDAGDMEQAADAVDDDDDADDDDDGVFTKGAMDLVRRPSESLGISMARSQLQARAQQGIDMGGFFIGGHHLEDALDDELGSSKPALQNLPVTAFPVGSHVWVADPSDVVTIMRARFEPAMESVCGGRVRGTVLRHSGDVVTCAFPTGSDGVACTYGIPRACLFNHAIERYDVKFAASNGKLFSDGAGLGPKAGHDKKVPEPKFGLLAPIVERTTIGSPCRATRAVMDALVAEDIEKARSVVDALTAGTCPTSGASSPQLSMGLSLHGPSSPPGKDADALRGITDPLDTSTIRHNRALLAMAVEDLDECERVSDLPRAMASDSLTHVLRMWHLRLMAGKFNDAVHLINHATLLAPHETSLGHLSKITTAFRRHTSAIRDAPIALAASYRLERVTTARRYFIASDVVCADEALVSAPGLDVPANTICAWCYNSKAGLTRSEAPGHVFCDEQCFRQSWDGFLEVELVTHEFSTRSARYLLETRRASEHFVTEEEEPLLQSACLAIRVWSILLSLAARPQESGVTLSGAVEAKLDQLGLFPFPDGVVFRGLRCKVEYQIKALYSVLAGKLNDELRALFTLDFFRGLVTAAHTYCKTVLYPPALATDNHVPVSVVTRASGTVPIYIPRHELEPNAFLQRDDAGHLWIIASAVIDSGERLVVM